MEKSFYFLLLLFLIIACKKEETVLKVPVAEKYLIQSEDYNGSLSVRYLYNAEHKISEIQSYFLYDRFCYDKNGRLARKETELNYSSFALPNQIEKNELKTAENSTINFYTDYIYNGNNIRKAVHYSKEGEMFKMVSFQTFQYKGDLVTRINLYDRENKLAQFDVYEYDAAGNVSKTQNYSYISSQNGQPYIVSESTYKYDDKHNPFRIFKELGYPGIYTNPNNVIESTTTFYIEAPGMPAGRVDKSKTTYEYNDDGYPVKPISETGLSNTVYKY